MEGGSIFVIVGFVGVLIGWRLGAYFPLRNWTKLVVLAFLFGPSGVRAQYLAGPPGRVSGITPTRVAYPFDSFFAPGGATNTLHDVFPTTGCPLTMVGGVLYAKIPQCYGRPSSSSTRIIDASFTVGRDSSGNFWCMLYWDGLSYGPYYNLAGSNQTDLYFAANVPNGQIVNIGGNVGTGTTMFSGVDSHFIPAAYNLDSGGSTGGPAAAYSSMGFHVNLGGIPGQLPFDAATPTTLPTIDLAAPGDATTQPFDGVGSMLIGSGTLGTDSVWAGEVGRVTPPGLFGAGSSAVAAIPTDAPTTMQAALAVEDVFEGFVGHDPIAGDGAMAVAARGIFLDQMGGYGGIATQLFSGIDNFLFAWPNLASWILILGNGLLVWFCVSSLWAGLWWSIGTVREGAEALVEV